MDLSGQGWRLRSANGSVTLSSVAVPGYALQALQDAAVVGDPLYRWVGCSGGEGRGGGWHGLGGGRGQGCGAAFHAMPT